MDIESIQGFAQKTGIYAFMNSAWGWPSIESLHFIALATLLGTVGLFDLRVLGFARGVSISALHRLVPFGVVAFVVSVLSGSLFFVTAPDQYAFNPAFQLKIVCMLIAGINVAVFYACLSKSMRSMGSGVEASLAVKVIAAVSLISWLGVITFGRLITTMRPPYHWCFWC